MQSQEGEKARASSSQQGDWQTVYLYKKTGYQEGPGSKKETNGTVSTIHHVALYFPASQSHARRDPMTSNSQNSSTFMKQNRTSGN